MDLEARIRELLVQFEADAKSAPDKLRSKYVGREGLLRELFGIVARLPADQKGPAGRRVNEFKAQLESRITQLAAARPVETKPSVDRTLPGSAPEPGRRHPVYRVWDEIVCIFQRLGFDVVYGPEIETEYHNFEALNIPLEHPSRDAFDTFYIEKPVLLRSHTSPVQIRTMKERKPPIRVLAPGKVFRPDKPDAGHSPMFHQVEGLMVGEDVTFAQLKGVLELFAQSMWGVETKIRFRPHFFPFTEPSAEVDVNCFLCQSKGCSVCGGKGWLELLGAGSVDPFVFEQVGYDPKRVQGFAFGLGVERIAMLRHGIPDIRLFYENDLRLLRQF